ncbi:class I SAM-dependent methyltransferase [Polynucleobacter paneuropaeus]|nr:class I SAM-dependent methyltransferase [Polynucleobacter paneuropaeus]
MDLKEVEQIQNVESHWYYLSKARAVLAACAKHNITGILDIGAGSGFFSKFILRSTAAKFSCCVDIAYPQEFEELDFGKVISYKRSIESTQANLILFMDVLEHVEDDLGLLREYIEKTPDNSIFVITVPAFMSLWSDHDEFLGHKRRYKLAQIEQVIKNSGLNMISGNYYFASIFPLVYLIRSIRRYLKINEKQSHLKDSYRFVNSLLLFICKVELSLTSINRWFGISVVCVASKQNS